MCAVQRFEYSTCDFSSSERATVRCLTARSYISARKSSMATSFSVSTAALMVDSGKRSIFSASSACPFESASESKPPYSDLGSSASRSPAFGTIAPPPPCDCAPSRAQ